ncbi:MAG: putative glycosyltransferase [Actinomycetia bacterium]|nr:putative glycosyltransferase [Actinomycetes bacterium]
METSESPGGAGLLEPLEPVVTAPPVVAIVVTNDAGPWFEEALRSLAAQDYPSLSVLVLDNGSGEDPTPRIAAVMPRAFVRRLDAKGGFPGAANQALDTVEGATFLLFCHDDVAFEPDAVRVMVEEAYRSNAGIVGPKLVDHDHPELLLEVGMTIDHYGVPFSGLEPNEVDQEQHDAVRDVFYVSHAAMLVRADLFEELRGFDVATFPGSDDLDLCWRARLAGARVLVAPDARVRHRQVAAREERVIQGSPAAVTRAATRGRVRVLMKSYSGLALLWVLPTGFVLSVVEAVGLVFARQFGRARGLISGWLVNLRQIGDVRRARRAAQALRRVDDGDVRELMVRGSARVRTLMTRRFRAPDRLQNASTRTREAVDRAGGRMRHPASIATMVVAVVLLVGSRDLLFGRVPEVGALRQWPGVGALFHSFWSPWQRTGLGVAGPASPAYAFMAMLSTVLFGHVGLARTIAVEFALPLGGWGAYKLARPLARSPFPALATAVAYAVNPLPRNAIAQGHLGSLVLYAFAPLALAALVRATGAPAIGEESAATAPSRRSLLVVAFFTAIIAAFFPFGLFFAPLAGVAFLLAAPLVGGVRFATRTLGAAVLAVLIAAVLLIPWTFSWFGTDGAALGLVARQPLGLGATLRFASGPAGAGWAPWGLLVAAALPLVVATGSRLVWTGRAWILVAASYGLAWLPGRLDHALARPEPEGLLVGAALGLALATGLGVSAFADDLRSFLFGWRQFAAVAAVLGLLLPMVGLFADSIGGRWRLPTRDWAQSVAWMHDDLRAGDFRVLWVGDPDVLPVGARDSHGTSYGLSQNGPGDARNAFLAPAGGGETVMGDAIGLLTGRKTARFGHLLAPMGVRYIALVRRAAPGGGATRPYDPRVAASLGEQLDLAVVQAEPDMLLYQNEAWAPIRAVVPSNTKITASRAGASAEALRAELQGASPVLGPLHASRVTKSGTMLFSDAYDSRWRANANQGTALKDERAFGWSNAYTGVTAGTVDLRYDGGVARPLWLALEALAWIATITLWFVLRRRNRAGSTG